MKCQLTIGVDSVTPYRKVTTHDKLFIGLIHSHKSEADAGFIWIMSDYVVHATKQPDDHYCQPHKKGGVQ